MDVFVSRGRLSTHPPFGPYRQPMAEPHTCQLCSVAVPLVGVSYPALIRGNFPRSRAVTRSSFEVTNDLGRFDI